jgi:sortase A
MPRLGIDSVVVGMDWRVVTDGGVRRVEWEVPEGAAGHAINSANPGEVGNVVITGHHNIKGEVFRGLWNAREGDEIILYAQGGAHYRYVVVRDALILPEKGATEEERQAHARYMDQTSDSRVTLITCWPYHDDTHRVIVIGLLES